MVSRIESDDRSDAVRGHVRCPPGLAAQKGWVERVELVDYLARATASKLLLVDAPAGFGKTTLIAQWRSSQDESRPFAWVSLDPGDNDPSQLWWHVAHALQQACPKLDADEIMRAVRSRAPDITQTILPLLINKLAVLPEPLVLVLDDYHVIRERDCHDQVAFLVSHLPQALQLVLITRAHPPLPLARWRASREMVEVRARELRFGLAQAAELVAAVGIELSQTDLADLVDRAGGWPAGIYLAALSMRGHPSPGDFIRQFIGNSRFVVDFLTEEVLSSQPDEIRRFLARTSILSRFSAPLCQAVAGSANAAEIIGTLERENLFVIPLDDNRQWFRYCHLFAQVLRNELARTEPEIVPALHERASAWYRQSGSADEAICHAHAAGDVTGAVNLIAGNWPAYVDSGQVAKVRGWLSPLGDSRISADPVAAHCAAWAAALSGDRESLRRWLPVIEAAAHDGPLPDGIRSLQSSAALLKGTFGLEGIGPMREAATQATRLETDPASPWYAVARASCAAAAFWSGDRDAAAIYAQAALSGTGSRPAIRMLGHAILSLIAVDQGNPDDAEQHARIAREIMAAAGPDLRAAPWGTVEILARLDRLEGWLAARPPEIPLTEREAAVLRLLCGTLSLREIGQELCLSQNTIKSHAKAIYRKLDVATRHDAIARGREIGIL
jgi:LuxR family maltose regulon positive regulatory protein